MIPRIGSEVRTAILKRSETRGRGVALGTGSWIMSETLRSLGADRQGGGPARGHLDLAAPLAAPRQPEDDGVLSLVHVLDAEPPLRVDVAEPAARRDDDVGAHVGMDVAEDLH